MGTLDSRLDLARTDSLALVDEWLDLSVGLQWSTPGGLWCFPVETVSLEGGEDTFELVGKLSADGETFEGMWARTDHKKAYDPLPVKLTMYKRQ